ncbi:ATPase [candidate division WOR-3 bacterium]|uniref:ATPase n=1 Tax=candidate division WOR-3 bacterium TaxID=2052148 RepID=A0A660SGL6_UNCW3|nr:MAG: ATPase [candidate division WOR-3 bacterium]
MNHLKRIISQIRGRGYGAYQGLNRRRFSFPGFELIFDHIQKDPFAPGTRVRLVTENRIPEWAYENDSKLTALEDFLLRRFSTAARENSRRRGEGKSGLIYAYQPSQKILKRSAVRITRDRIEVRFYLGLPSRGRRILAREFEEMVFGDLPKIFENSLNFSKINRDQLTNHINICVAADYLRTQLKKLGLVAFIGDGAILPRRSGVDDRPMGKEAIPFRSPDSLRVELNLPHLGRVTGLGIREGVTLIVGGGFHGKSTLLRAIEHGIYNHIPGDGRELVVTIPEAVRIRAEDGRSVQSVDISPFIKNLPQRIDTSRFTTENASGSTSQAANIVEAIEAGAKLLLIDEDTSATNFMIRDGEMRRLIPDELEPITPFLDRVQPLYHEYGISSIIVTGGSGEYLKVADTVIGMFNYLPRDLSSAVKRRKREGSFGPIRKRFLKRDGFSPLTRSGKVKARARGREQIIFGTRTIDLRYVGQIVEPGQTNGLAQALLYIWRRYLDKGLSLREMVDRLITEIESGGLDIVTEVDHPPDLAHFRGIDLAAVINRIRGIRIRTE